MTICQDFKRTKYLSLWALHAQVAKICEPAAEQAAAVDHLCSVLEQRMRATALGWLLLEDPLLIKSSAAAVNSVSSSGEFVPVWY